MKKRLDKIDRLIVSVEIEVLEVDKTLEAKEVLSAKRTAKLSGSAIQSLGTEVLRW